MKDFDKTIKDNYSKKPNTLKFGRKKKDYAISESSNHSSTIRRGTLVTSSIAVGLVIALATGVGASGTAIYHSLQNRTAVVETEDTVQERNCDPLPESRFDIIGIADPNIDGNCYMQDFYELQKQHFISYDKYGDGTIVTEPLDYTLTRNWAYLFDDDCYTIIGKLVINQDPDDEDIFRSATYSSEELEDPEIQKLLTGTEEENAEYEERIRTLLEARKQEEPLEPSDTTNDNKVNKYGEVIGTVENEVFFDEETSAWKRLDMLAVDGGYCYLEDWDEINNIVVVELTGKNSYTSTDTPYPTKRNWVYVFNEDGDKIIGKFILTHGIDQFQTNKQLEDPHIQTYVSATKEAEEAYESKVNARLEAKGVSRSEAMTESE